MAATITTTNRRLTALVLTGALALGVAACGGGGSDSAGAGGTDEVTATLAIISTNIETDRDARGFEAATEGETLTVGDQVRTDPTGFAELTYHDGSWQRIENSATLTIDELTNAGDTNTVRTSVDVGDTWNRVETLTEPDDAYTLDTPVATAAVRGTAFATQCPTTDECTFSVIDGTVEITPDTGDPVTLTAGQQITITTDTPPPAPETPGVDTLSQDPFIAENLTLDQTKTTDTSGDSGDGNGEGASGAPADVDVCALFTTDDVKTIVDDNVVAVFFPGFEVVAVDPGAATADGSGCGWHLTVFDARDFELSGLPDAAKDIFTKDDPNLVFVVNAIAADGAKASTCMVTAGGVCLQTTGVNGSGGAISDVTVPAAVESRIQQSLGG